MITLRPAPWWPTVFGYLRAWQRARTAALWRNLSNAVRRAGDEGSLAELEFMARMLDQARAHQPAFGAGMSWGEVPLKLRPCQVEIQRELERVEYRPSYGIVSALDGMRLELALLGKPEE